MRAKPATQFNLTQRHKGHNVSHFCAPPRCHPPLLPSGLRSAGRGKRLLARGRATLVPPILPHSGRRLVGTLALQPSRLRVKQQSSAFTLTIASHCVAAIREVDSRPATCDLRPALPPKKSVGNVGGVLGRKLESLGLTFTPPAQCVPTMGAGELPVYPVGW